MAQQQNKLQRPPATGHAGMDSFLDSVYQRLQNDTSYAPPPQPVTALTVTPVAGGNVVQFTRSNALNFRLYWGTTPSFKDAHNIVDLGPNNNYQHNLGQAGQKVYYWVQAQSSNASSSAQAVGPVSGTTLALGTGAAITPPTQPSYMMVFDTTINAYRPAIYGHDYVSAPKQPHTGSSS